MTVSLERRAFRGVVVIALVRSEVHHLGPMITAHRTPVAFVVSAAKTTLAFDGHGGRMPLDSLKALYPTVVADLAHGMTDQAPG